MIRDLGWVFSVPRRLVEGVDESRDLLARLADAIPRMERKFDDVARDISRTRMNSEDQPQTLEELRQARATLERMDARLQRVEAIQSRLESTVAEVRAKLPVGSDGSGPLSRARGAFTGR